MTRFPQLPVMGHVPKKRAKPVLPPLTFDEIKEVLDKAYEEAVSDDVEWAIQGIIQKIFEAAKAKKRTALPKPEGAK